MSTPPTAGSAPPSAPATWQLQLRRADAGNTRPAAWQADAVGPGGSRHFGSIAELSAWLAQLDATPPPEPRCGPGIR